MLKLRWRHTMRQPAEAQKWFSAVPCYEVIRKNPRFEPSSIFHIFRVNGVASAVAFLESLFSQLSKSALEMSLRQFGHFWCFFEAGDRGVSHKMRHCPLRRVGIVEYGFYKNCVLHCIINIVLCKISFPAVSLFMILLLLRFYYFNVNMYNPDAD